MRRSPIKWTDPQSWNLYSYVRNNPLAYVDATGTIASASTGGSEAEGSPECGNPWSPCGSLFQLWWDSLPTLPPPVTFSVEPQPTRTKQSFSHTKPLRIRLGQPDGEAATAGTRDSGQYGASSPEAMPRENDYGNPGWRWDRSGPQ